MLLDSFFSTLEDDDAILLASMLGCFAGTLFSCGGNCIDILSHACHELAIFQDPDLHTVLGFCASQREHASRAQDHCHKVYMDTGEALFGTTDDITDACE